MSEAAERLEELRLKHFKMLLEYLAEGMGHDNDRYVLEHVFDRQTRISKYDKDYDIYYGKTRILIERELVIMYGWVRVTELVMGYGDRAGTARLGENGYVLEEVAWCDA